MENNELYHYGVKGMKWGVRRNRQSRAQKDARKLANATTKYYERSNSYNSLVDLRAPISNHELKALRKSKRQADKLVRKSQKRYSTVSAIPEFQKNGYIVKSVDATIQQMDRQGRLKRTAKSSNPVETFDFRGGQQYRQKYDKIAAKYDKKLKSAKSEEERERLMFEREDEIDNIRLN